MSAGKGTGRTNQLMTFVWGAAIGFSTCYAIYWAGGFNGRGPAPGDQNDALAPLPVSEQQEAIESLEPMAVAPVTSEPAPEPPPQPEPQPSPSPPTAIPEPVSEPPEAGRHLFLTASGATLTAGEQAILGEVQPAGVVISERNCRNAESAKALVAAVKQAWRGGRTGREAPLIVLALTEAASAPLALDDLPAAARLGADGDQEEARNAGHTLGRACRARGIDVVLGPRLDVAGTKNVGAGEAGLFGSDHLLVAALGLAFADGIMAEGVLPVVSTYPGCAGLDYRTGDDLPALDGKTTVVAPAIYPFAEAARCGIPGLLAGHVAVPAIDDHSPPRPASLSPVLIQDAIRGSWRYEGVVVADNLNLSVLARSRTLGETAVAALAAGCDAFVLARCEPERVRAVCDAVDEAQASGVLSGSRLEASNARIGAWRKWLRAPTRLTGPIPVWRRVEEPAPETAPADAVEPPPREAEAVQPEQAEEPEVQAPEPEQKEATGPDDDTADSEPTTKRVVYTIQRGDSLLRIAKTHHVRVSDIVEWNNLRDQNDIKWGLKLVLHVPEE